MTIKINKYAYLSKKFLGLVIAFDFNRPDAMPYYKHILLIEVKLFFIGFYIDLKELK